MSAHGPMPKSSWIFPVLAVLFFAGATALFITGCGADANPNPRGSLALSRAHGLQLAIALFQAPHFDRGARVDRGASVDREAPVGYQ